MDEQHVARSCNADRNDVECLPIVGRGTQCILVHKHDSHHVFVYASLRERILRLRKPDRFGKC